MGFVRVGSDLVDGRLGEGSEFLKNVSKVSGGQSGLGTAGFVMFARFSEYAHLLKCSPNTKPAVFISGCTLASLTAVKRFMFSF